MKALTAYANSGRALRSAAAIKLALGVILAARLGQAQDPARAEVLFREARSAYEAGDMERACEGFAESQRLEPAPGTRLNLALCEARRGRVATAWVHYQALLDQLEASDERHAFVQQRLTELEPQIPHLLLRLDPRAPKSSRISCNGSPVPAASLGVAVPVDPGAQHCEVMALGFERRNYELKVERARTYVLQVEPGAALEQPRKAAPLKAASPPARADLAWVPVFAAGLSAIAVGAATGLAAIKAKEDVDRECDADRTCSQQGLDAVKRGRLYSLISTGAISAGVVAVGASVYFRFLAPQPRSGVESASVQGVWCGVGSDF